MPTIVVDRRAYEVREGVNLLDACLTLGLDVPYFCWHPAMGSAGACRQCAVTQYRNDEDTRGRIVMACMTPAADGVRISIADRAAADFRKRVAEWLMVHHPHDCPVCDEGGECHLQDMTVLNGHTYRRYRGLKRTFRNQDLGPFVAQEMNRCIQCYRCVRYYRDYAGGRDFDAHFIRDRVFFGRHEDGVLESEFSGNLVEVCPTGVFTDRTLARHYTRKWDERTAPSVCVHCSVGCNTIPGERYGMLRRIRARFNHDVNGYFLCDRGRYGYEFVNGDGRLRAPAIGRGPERVAVGAAEAVERAAGLFGAGARAIGIGSPRASLEANFALRTLVGPERFFQGVSPLDGRLVSLVLDILRDGPVPAASLHEVDRSDAAFVIGEDVTATAPMLALALRQSVRRQPMAVAARQRIPEWDDIAVRHAVQDAKGPLFIASPAATRLDDVATATMRGAPDDLARLGLAVAHAIDPQAPDPGLEALSGPLVARIAQSLREASAPVVVAGTGVGSPAILEAAANVAWALARAGCRPRLAFALPECNSAGAALLGGAGDLQGAFDAIARGEADTVVVLENDLYRRSTAAAVQSSLGRVAHLVVIDHVRTPTARDAGIALPAGTFAESDGTLVNNEGRAQRYFQVLEPDGEVQESWRWVRDLLAASGRPGGTWRTFDDVVAALAEEVPALAGIREAAPPATFRTAGLRVARAPHRYSGRTAMTADRTVHEPKPPVDADSALSFTMEGFQGQPPPALVPRFWAPGWNSVQSVNFYQREIGGPLRGGETGRRLIDPSAGGRPYFDRVPAPFSRDRSAWLCVPVHETFGSEELSALAGALATRVPRPWLALNPADLERAGLADGASVRLDVGGVVQALVVRAWPSLPAGLAGVVVGLPGQEWLSLPGPGRMSGIERTR